MPFLTDEARRVMSFVFTTMFDASAAAKPSLAQKARKLK
jgi:hypothetical protein